MHVAQLPGDDLMSTPTTDQQDRASEKRVSTIRALLALRGIHCYDCTEGGWLVCNHSMSRHCPTLDDLEAFARQVGAIR